MIPSRLAVMLLGLLAGAYASPVPAAMAVSLMKRDENQWLTAILSMSSRKTSRKFSL